MSAHLSDPDPLGKNPGFPFLGSRLVRVDSPGEHSLCFEFDGFETASARYLDVQTSEGRALILRRSESRTKGTTPNAFAMLLRKNIQGKRVAGAVSYGADVFVLHFEESKPVDLAVPEEESSLSRSKKAKREKKDEPKTVALVFESKPANVILLRQGKILGTLQGDLLKQRKLRPGGPYPFPGAPEEPWMLAGAVRGKTEATDPTVAELALKPVQKRLLKEKVRVTRKRDAIRSDLKNIEGADSLRAQGSSILSWLTNLPEREFVAKIPHFETGEPLVVARQLGDAWTAAANRLFKKAQKLTAAQGIASARLKSTEDELAAIEGKLESLAKLFEGHESLAEDDAWIRGLLSPRGKTESAPKQERKPFREYRASDGTPIWVGRSSTDNDQLTFRMAKPHDWFFHARGTHGSHVIVVAKRNERPSAEAVLDAACLAAHFSKERSEDAVEVQFVPRKWVRKAKGGAPGLVVLEREEVLLYRQDEARLGRLLRGADS